MQANEVIKMEKVMDELEKVEKVKVELEKVEKVEKVELVKVKVEKVEKVEKEKVKVEKVKVEKVKVEKVKKEKVKKEKILRKTYTVTFGDVAENHARNQQIGKIAAKGHSVAQLMDLKERVERMYGVKCEFVNLGEKWEGDGEVKEAGVLVMRKLANAILGVENLSAVMAENDAFAHDTKAKMRGKVVEKRARHNVCFDDKSQVANYEAGEGTIIAWEDVPMTATVRMKICELLGEEEPLKGEANYYYDLDLCGIGYHGDGERKKVVAMRMGEAMSIHFQWFQRSKAVGENVKIVLEDGDMYVMSEKAVGFDWLKKKEGTLRHAAGCDKFTVIKEEKKKIVAKEEEKE